MTKSKRKDIFIEGAIPASLIAEQIEKHSSKTDIGAHQIFLGQVRADEMDGKAVEAIEYSAHKELVEGAMQQIREDLFAKYTLSCMHVYHSQGRVKAGQICLFVFVSSAHRGPCTEACQELVERIKAELPIWGKELFAGEDYQWKVNK